MTKSGAPGPAVKEEAFYPADPEVVSALSRFLALDTGELPGIEVERTGERIRLAVAAKRDAEPFETSAREALLQRFDLRLGDGESRLPAEMGVLGRWSPMRSDGRAGRVAPSYEHLRSAGIARAASGGALSCCVAIQRLDLPALVGGLLGGDASGVVLPSELGTGDLDRIGALLSLRRWSLIAGAETISPWSPFSAWRALLEGVASLEEARGALSSRLHGLARSGAGVVLLWPGGGREDSASIGLLGAPELSELPVRVLFLSPPDERLPSVRRFVPPRLGAERLGEVAGLVGAPPDRFDLLRRALEIASGELIPFGRALRDRVDSDEGREWWSGRRRGCELTLARRSWALPSDSSLRALARAAARPGGIPGEAASGRDLSQSEGFLEIAGRIHWRGEPPDAAPRSDEVDRSLHRWLAELVPAGFERAAHRIAAGEAEAGLAELEAAEEKGSAGSPEPARLALQVAGDATLPSTRRGRAFELAGRFALDAEDANAAARAFRSAIELSGSDDDRRRRSILLARACWFARDVRAGLEALPPGPDRDWEAARVRVALLRASGQAKEAGALIDGILEDPSRFGVDLPNRTRFEAEGADLLAELGEFRRALALSEASLAKADSVGDPILEAEVRRWRGYVLYHFGDPGASSASFHEALERAGSGRIPALEADIWNDLGVLCRARFDDEGARRAFERSVALDRELGRRVSRLGRLANLASVAMSTGDLDRAREVLAESIPGLEELGLRHSLLFDLVTDAQLALFEGDLPRAAARLRVPLGPEGASHPARGAALLLAAELDLLRGDRDEALVRLRDLARTGADLRGEEPRNLLLARLLGRVEAPWGATEIPRPLARELALAGALGNGTADAEGRNAHRRETPHRLPLFVRLAAKMLGEERVAEADPALVGAALEAAARLGAEGHSRALRPLVRGFAGESGFRAAVAELVATPEKVFSVEGQRARRDAGLGEGPIRLRLRGRIEVIPPRSNPATPIWVPLREEDGDRAAVDVEAASARDLDDAGRRLLVAIVDRALEQGDRFPSRSPEEEGELRELAARHRILTTGPPLAEALGETRRLAAHDVPVFLHGESGTGKELFARLLHEGGPRRRGRFVAFNVASMPETLVESELFGALRGAYTGADRDRPGLFEAAHRGTLFLDEIVEMPLPIQAKMLRAIQEKEIRRLGDTVSRPIDVRIVSASHGSLEENVAKGRFREDLYYRIGMTVVRIPPLRERGDDLAMLIGQFLAEIGREAGTTPTLTAEAKRLLLAHPWPGNVRELVNTLRGAAALAGGGRIGAAQLPAALRTRRIAKAGGPSLPERVREERKREIEAALVSSGGNVTKAATLLGVTRQAVHHDVVRLGIDVASFRPRKK